MNKTNYAKWLRMATITKNNKATRGFTLVEMIGVLAIIAILAGMLIPKIFEAIRNSRINATIQAYNTLKAAVLENYAKWGRFATTSGVQYTGTEFDKILFEEGRIDARAADKIPLSTEGGTAYVYVSVATDGGKGGGGYDLDGDGTTDTGNAAYVVELFIGQVAIQDARELSLRLDGPNLSATDLGSYDDRGRVEYIDPTDYKTDVYIYIAHQ